MHTFFISYGDEKYEKSKQRITKEATAFGFDTVCIYDRTDLTDEFIERSCIDFSARGGGHWMYKPFVLVNAIAKMNYGDIGVYCDMGCTIGNTAKDREWWDQFISVLTSHDRDIILFEQKFTDAAYTKIEVFDYFGIDVESPIATSWQTYGGMFMFKKTEVAVALFQRWLDILYENPLYFNDENTRMQHLGYVDHRHDQSILSLLGKLCTRSYRIMHDASMPFKVSRLRE